MIRTDTTAFTQLTRLVYVVIVEAFALALALLLDLARLLAFVFVGGLGGLLRIGGLLGFGRLGARLQLKILLPFLQ